MDNIDDLLAELETAAEGRQMHSKQTVPVSARISVAVDENNIDDLLNMMESVSSSTAQNYRPSANLPTQRTAHTAERTVTAPRAAPSSTATAARCDPVCLGPMDDGGQSRLGRERCPALRCTSCDFPVLLFPHSAWRVGADYMFFRLHCPDRAKLGAGLVQHAGAAAYCCQCSWLSVQPGQGVKVVRRSGLPVPPSSPEWATTLSSGLASAGGGGWASWTCAGHS